MNRLAAAIAGTPWVLLAFFGISTLSAGSKAGYYLFLPLAVLSAVVAGSAIGRYPHVRYVAYLTYAVALLALLPYLLFYSGGA